MKQDLHISIKGGVGSGRTVLAVLISNTLRNAGFIVNLKGNSEPCNQDELSFQLNGLRKIDTRFTIETIDINKD